MQNERFEPTSSIDDLHPSSLLWRAQYAGFICLRTINALTDRTPLREMSRYHGSDIVRLEGFMRPKQFRWFSQLFDEVAIEHVGEVGFNGGHSAFTFAHNGAESVTSYDIGEHSYVSGAADFLRQRFPDTRLELVLGDSRQTVPEHVPQENFDMVFIDGGHSLDAATSDIANMRQLTNPGGLVVMDDYTDKYPWRTGPKVAYDRAVSDGIVEHIDVAQGDHRVWALGRYTA